MRFTSLRTRLFLTTAGIIALVVGIAWWSSAEQRGSSVVLPSRVIAERPSGIVTVEGVLVESEVSNGRLSLVLADPSAPEVGVLKLEYSGSQRVSFGRGTSVIAHGTLAPGDVFRVEEFVLK